MHSNSPAPINKKPNRLPKKIDANTKMHSLYGVPPLSPNEPVAQTAELIANLLTKIAKQNAHMPINTNAYTTEKIYPLSIQDYLKYIAQFLKFHLKKPIDVIFQEDLITALIYLDRFFCANTADFINEHNVHALLLVAVILAHKYLDDSPFKNYDLSCIYKIPVNTINDLENLFLETIQFDCYVSAETYQAYEECLLNSSQTTVYLATNTLLKDQSLFFPNLHFVKGMKLSEEDGAQCNDFIRPITFPEISSPEPSSVKCPSYSSTASTVHSEGETLSPNRFCSDPLPAKTLPIPCPEDPNPFHLTHSTSLFFKRSPILRWKANTDVQVIEKKMSLANII